MHTKVILCYPQNKLGYQYKAAWVFTSIFRTLFTSDGFIARTYSRLGTISWW
jgi:hypothetical protein